MPPRTGTNLIMSVQEQTEGKATLSPEERERRIAICEQVLRIYSPSGDERDLSRYLFSELESRHFHPKQDGAGNVICEVGSGSPSILLCGHMDTVPGEVPVRWEGNLLFGRGACDAKGPLLSMLFAFEDIAVQLSSRNRSKKGKVIFAAVTEEERGSAGLNELLKNNLKADSAIFGEPCGSGKVTVGYRGHVPTTVEIFSNEVHGSAPWLAANPAEIAFSIYQSAKEMWPCKERRSTDCISVALTQIHSGRVDNVTPDKAAVSLDVRVPFGMGIEEVKSKLQNLVSSYSSRDVRTKIEFGDVTEPYKTVMSSNLVRAVNRSFLKSMLPRPEYVVKSGTGDMNTYALTFGVDAITYGPGDTKLSHTKEEKVSVEEIFQCSNILKSIALEYFELFEKQKE